ncbi:Nramp family divalent metal transporter [Pseudomonas aeruginosa]
MKYSLPTTATAPFCPSAVSHSVAVPADASPLRKLALFVGPGLLVSVGYMDPGNWATAIEAGSRFGYALLFVVVLASFSGMLLQSLCSRLGIATGRDLAQLSRERYRPGVARGQWLLAELSIVATDLAEVLGAALAFHLLLGVSITTGVVLTAFDTLIVLALQGANFRRLEAIVLGLIATIGACFFVELVLIGPYWPDVAAGLRPSWDTLSSQEPLYLAIGILGATVMPHNLYLHSSVVQTRVSGDDAASKRSAIRFPARHHRLAVPGAAGQCGDPDPRRRGFPRQRPYRGGGDPGRLPPARPVGGRRPGQLPVRLRPAGGGAKLDLHRHHCRAGGDGGFPPGEDSLLAAAPDHPRPGPGAGLDRRALAGRRRGRQAAGAQPGGAQPAIAVRPVAADSLQQRPGPHGEFVNPRWVSALAWSLFGLISAANLTLLYFWFG